MLWGALCAPRGGDVCAEVWSSAFLMLKEHPQHTPPLSHDSDGSNPVCVCTRVCMYVHVRACMYMCVHVCACVLGTSVATCAVLGNAATLPSTLIGFMAPVLLIK